MTFRHACSVVAAVVVAFALSGCFVVSKNLPAGAGAAVDERLVGAWRGVDADGGEEHDAFLHFLKPEPNKGPLRLVWVEDQKFQLYDVHTMKIGAKNAFAARLLTPPEDSGDEIPAGYFLGFYDVSGNEIVFRMLDAEKVGELIAKGRVKGTRPPGKYEIATLTGSPAELAAFLASPAAEGALVNDPAHMRRLTPRKK